MGCCVSIALKNHRFHEQGPNCLKKPENITFTLLVVNSQNDFISITLDNP